MTIQTFNNGTKAAWTYTILAAALVFAVAAIVVWAYAS